MLTPPLVKCTVRTHIFIISIYILSTEHRADVQGRRQRDGGLQSRESRGTPHGEPEAT